MSVRVMKIIDKTVSRRSVLAGGAAAFLGYMVRPVLRQAKAQTQAAIVASPVDEVPELPVDPRWTLAKATTIPLNPQDLVLPRIFEAATASVEVRALYDANQFGLLVEWGDSARDVDLGTVLQYRDAAAIQFPEDPTLDAASFMMGQKGVGVTIYHWKSDWQFSRLHDVDEAYPNMYGDWYPLSGVPAGEIPESTDYLTKGNKEFLTAAAAGNVIADPLIQEAIGPIQKMRAEGFGTLEPDAAQDAQGMGAWFEGRWRVVISIPRQQSRFRFEEGSVLPFSFAVWDGAHGERNGQKAFSFWHDLSLGAAPASILTPTSDDDGGGFLMPLLGSVGGVAVAAVATVIGFRVWRGRQAPPDEDES
ncbi:MAG: hypothetical protein CMI32_03985 [Opitutales bacterium]|nr:hypothetical protein [Opitutales bacterium]